MAFDGRLVPLIMRDNFWADDIFSPMWMDFEGMTRAVMRDFDQGFKSRDASGHCNTCKCQDEKQGEKEAAAATADAGKTKPPTRQLLRFFSNDPFKGDVNWVDDQVMKVKEDEKGMEISIATHDYKPDEIKVTVKHDTGMLKVEGNHEEKAEDGSKYVKRHFIRQYQLPKGCLPDMVSSNLSSDGVLMIHAPKQEQPEAIEQERQVPIQKN